jgi:hypothetical protein
LELRQHAVPLSTKCFYRDGTSEQLVPPVVNLILLALVVAALTLCILGFRALYSRHPSTSIHGGYVDDHM